uniref:Profilin n=1 Tax=Brugia malayi TaxID=6279 RepID=A0A0I9N9U1_BRUMA|nr:Bm3825 [Brugia malayi]
MCVCVCMYWIRVLLMDDDDSFTNFHHPNFFEGIAKRHNCPINNCRMSGWAAYIKNLLDSSQGIQRAAIVGYPDGSVWARSEGDREFRATDEELKKFVTLYDHIEKVPAVGCDLEGVHYIVPRTEQNLIFGKRDKTGIFAAKTKSAVLIACYKGENAAEVH